MRTIYAALLTVGALVGPASAYAEETASVPKSAARATESSVVGPALYVTDIERSLRFYRDVLGMTVKMRYGPAGKEDVVLGFGSDPRQLGLMLLSDKSAATPRKIEHGHGFSRFAVNVGDIAAVKKRLRDFGMPPAEIRKVHGTVQMMMTSDPDGYAIEITQMG